jgi:hypothetical protein
MKQQKFQYLHKFELEEITQEKKKSFVHLSSVSYLVLFLRETLISLNCV